MKKSVFILVINLLLISCTSENNKSEVREIYYFDLKSYFENEAIRLSKAKTVVNKSIEHNTSVESKTTTIDNWTDEFALFTESDINKKSWKESYKIDSTLNKLTYTAKDAELKTQIIAIDFLGNKPTQIKIVNKTHNYLYKTDEVLHYFPDSLYIINKKQEVTLLGKNNYKIKGLFYK